MRPRTRRSIVHLFAGAWLAVGFGCAVTSSTPDPPRASEPSIASPPAAAETWIAVYDVAEDPNDLEDERSQIVHALGDPLEGSVVVSPAGCFDGLPVTIAHGSYVLAIEQSERVYLRALGQELDGSPRFVGRITVMCTD
jgi:hypothetical protein